MREKEEEMTITIQSSTLQPLSIVVTSPRCLFNGLGERKKKGKGSRACSRKS